MVAPPITISASGEHQGFPGTLSIGSDVMADVVIEVARSADWAAGVVFVNGHGGNVAAMQRAAAVFREERRHALIWWPHLPEGDPHAGHTETSLMLALAPDQVRFEAATSGPVPTIAELIRHGVRPPQRNGGARRPDPCQRRRWRRALSATGRPARRSRRRLERVMPPTARYLLDATVQIHDSVVIGGSPLKLFRLTPAGARVVSRIAAGDTVDDSKLTAALLDAGAIHPIRTTPRHTIDDVTVVVPTLGVAEHAPTGAIVVDDGSWPPVPDARRRLATNQGPAAARNAGLELVTTPLVAFVDSDVELGDDWLAPLLAHFADERVALVAPRVSTARDDTAIGKYEHLHSPLDLGPDPARVRPGTRISYVPAAAIVCRTDAIRAIGGFDPSLRFGEDVDLVWRLAEAGWVCRYEPAAVVHHARRPDLGFVGPSANRVRIVGGGAVEAPPWSAGAAADERLERRRLGVGSDRPARVRRPGRRRFGDRPHAQAARHPGPSLRCGWQGSAICAPAIRSAPPCAGCGGHCWPWRPGARSRLVGCWLLRRSAPDTRCDWPTTWPTRSASGAA